MRSLPTSSPRLRALFWGLYAFLLAFLILALFVDYYGVDVPYWDEWVELPFYAARRAGTLSWHDLYAQHNEHRILVSRLLWVGLFDLFGEWNVIVQMASSAVVMGLAVGMLGYTLARLRVSPVIIVGLSVLLTSPVQWDNILWGYQVHSFTLVVGAVLSICAIALDDALRPRTIALCIVGCTFATFSFASGLGFWAAVGATLVLRGVLITGSLRALAARRALCLRLGIFALAAIVCSALFFIGYTVVHNELKAGGPLAMLKWMVRVLAYPLVEDTGTPLPNLALALALWACVAMAMVRDWRHRQAMDAQARLVLFAGLALILFVNAVITGYGRGGTPYVPSRYGTILLLNNVLWLVAVANLVRGDTDGARAPSPALRVALCALAGGLLVLHGNRYLAGVTIMQGQRANREVARDAVAYYLRDHSPGLPFQGFAVFPPHVRQQGDLGRPELLAVLPPDMLPELTAMPVVTLGGAWAADCAYEGTAGPRPTQSWGSWCRSGALGTGQIGVGPIAIREPVLRIPFAGYAGVAGTALVIQDIADRKHRLQYAGPPPGDTWGTWDADVSSFVGHDVLVIGVDSSAEAPGWLAFGRPRPMSRALWWFDRGLNQVGLALRLLLFASAGIVLALAHNWRGTSHPDEPAVTAEEPTVSARAPRVGARKRRG